MNPTDPLAALQALTDTQASRRAEMRAENRRRFPELAAITDTLPEGSWRMLCIEDHDGNVLMGKRPEKEPSYAEHFIALFRSKGLKV